MGTFRCTDKLQNMKGGAYENRRLFTFINNLKFIIEELITKDVTSGIYNIGDDNALSTNELKVFL